MKMIDSKRLRGNNGFTLIEVVVAMAILALFITAFSALFVQSYAGIMAAGNKSNASYDAQADVEQRLAEKNSNAEQNFLINFGTQSIAIKGGVISSTKTKSNQSSSMDSFLALIPTIKIKPYRAGDALKQQIELYDGYPDKSPLMINGSETHFSGSSILSITDKNGISAAGSTLDVDDGTTAVIYLAAGLSSKSSPYLITIRTGTESVSAYLKIKPIVKYAAAGNMGYIAFSENIPTWDANPWAADDNNLNNITEHNGEFITVGNAGVILYSSYYGHIWTSVNLQSPELLTNFKSIIWGNGKYVATGTGGMIYTFGEDPASRVCRVSGSLNEENIPDLNGVAYGKVNGFDKYVAVGAGGTILVSDNAESWSKVSANFGSIAPCFNAITYGTFNSTNYFIAVGQDGIIAFSTDGTNWSYIIPEENGINVMLTRNEGSKVNYNSVVCSNGKIIAAGGSSIHVISNDFIGSTNGTIAIGSAIKPEQPVNSITYSDGKYWAIYGGNTLYSSIDGYTWTNNGVISNLTNINSISIR